MNSDLRVLLCRSSWSLYSVKKRGSCHHIGCYCKLWHYCDKPVVMLLLMMTMMPAEPRPQHHRRWQLCCCCVARVTWSALKGPAVWFVSRGRAQKQMCRRSVKSPGARREVQEQETERSGRALLWEVSGKRRSEEEEVDWAKGMREGGCLCTRRI